MSYHIYTTRGLVVSTKPSREADRVYSILTDDFGIVRASAGGVRKINSKLRASLESLSVSDISLVKGKDFWKITNARLHYSIASKNSKKKIKVISQVLNLAEKLMTGERKEEGLLMRIETAIESIEDEVVLEIVLLSRILVTLGYMSKEKFDEKILEGELDSEGADYIIKHKKTLIKRINEGISSSGMAE